MSNLPSATLMIHIGNTERDNDSAAFMRLSYGQFEGCISKDNQVAGSYSNQQEHELDRLADALTTHLDWQTITPIITAQMTES